MSFHFIHPQKPQKKGPGSRYIIDIETNGLNAGNYVFGVLMNVDTGEHWVHRNPLALRTQLESFAPAIVYAHNAFGFDAWAFYSKMEVKNAQKLWKGSKLLSFKIEGIEWRDSTDLMSMRLASIGDALGFPKGITPEEYILGTVKEVTAEHIEYCVQDCEILRQALMSLETSFSEWCHKPIGTVQLPRTAASLAYRVWSSTSWPKHWGYERDGTFNSCGRCWDDHNDAFGAAYFGGRVQLLGTPGEVVGPIRSMDANSMFPSVMIDGLYPDIEDVQRCMGNPRILKGMLALKDRVIVADVTLNANGAPLFLPGTTEDGRRDWTQETFTGFLAQPELEHALEIGWELVSVRMIHHAKAIRPFVHYVNHFYTLRNEYKANGDGRQLFVKLLLNSLYGKFGQRPMKQRIDQDDKITNLMEKDNFDELYDLCFYDSQGQLPYLVKLTEASEPRSQWFGFAAFITSYARVELNKVILLAGDEALYCDTDSVHYLESAHERMLNSVDMGKELGQWELETPVAVAYAKYWEPKVYVHYRNDMTRTLVKHKGVSVKDYKGNFLKDAGDLTKEQPSLSTFGFAESFRKGVEPGRSREVIKRSRRWHIDKSTEA